MRIRYGLTQIEAAKALGTTQVTVSGWEAGRAYPPAKDLLRVARFYHCSVEELMQDYEQRIIPVNAARGSAAVQDQPENA